MVRERTSAGLAAAPVEGRIGGRRKKLDDIKRQEIADAVVSGRKAAAQMARMFGVSPPTVSRIADWAYSHFKRQFRDLVATVK